jgi:hypothetical protein
VDVAFLMVPKAATLDALSDAAAAGIRNAVVLSAGYAEAGPGGRLAEAELVAHAESLGVVLLGPNHLGFANFAAASDSASRVAAFGTIKNATSTGSPIPAHEVTVDRPCVSAPRRLTRYVRSAKPNSTRLRYASWENIDLSAAPTIATLRGRNSASSRPGSITRVPPTST